MEIVKIIFKSIIFLIGAALLVSGLFCGVTGLYSAPSAGGGYSEMMWMMGGIGLVSAALGGLLLGLIFGWIGKKKKLTAAGTALSPETENPDGADDRPHAP